MQASAVRHFSSDSMLDPDRERYDSLELRLQASPCRWHVYLGESVMEVVCGTLLIIIVFTEGSFDESGLEITEETLNFLFLASAVSGLKYTAMRLLPYLVTSNSASFPNDLGPISAWSRIAAQRQRIRARSWSIPVVAGLSVFLCLAILVWTTAQDLAAAYISAVMGINAFITADSFVAALVGCRQGYREIFPDVEFVKPVKYRELARGSIGRCDSKCAICLQDFVPQDSAVRLPCNHIFHTECAGKWMSRGHGCPFRCKRPTSNMLPP